jgi:uncharacterized membrane protein YsdA (DUF1294 family)
MKIQNSKKKIILLVILVLLVVALIGFVVYVSDYYHADSRALSALNNTSSYTVNNSADFITFTPTVNKSSTGLIIYPGAKVEAESYAVLASEIALRGYTTVIVKMPFNLAIFDVNKADQVINNHPEIKVWAIAGHSLGGVFASDYALNHQDKIKGVIYLASYPNNNASNATFKGLLIRGTEDNLTTSDDISKNMDKFPANTTFIYITGGNHFNVGDYGIQKGDNNSTIFREGQQVQNVMYIVEFLNSL